MDLQKKLTFRVLQYFNQFKYAPSFDELHIFYETEISQNALKKVINSLKKQRKVVEKDGRYTLGEYSKNIAATAQKQLITSKKKVLANWYIKLLSILPVVKTVGFSGSVSMNNASLPDDIDLFIITSYKRMWITRLIALLFAEAMGIRRRRGQTKAKDTICLNMFMEEGDLSIPKDKKTTYIAHEVLQLKPVLNREKTYENFLNANNWVFKMFPNAKKYYIKRGKNITNNIKTSISAPSFLGNFLELLAKKIQLFMIKKHTTTERITDTQLWFFPDDYEKKLKP